MTAPVAEMVPAWVDGTLVPVEKLDAHQRGLRHKAVSVFILDGDRILLQRRALTKYHTPGLWANTCCTHPRWDELPVDCARRRLREELGIEGVEPVFTDHVVYRADVGGGLIEHEEVDLFVAHARQDSLRVRPVPEEVAEVRWLTLGALRAEIAQDPGRFTPWLRIYLARHAAQIFPELVTEV